MAASRAARKREMIANLENEEYLNDLANESYAPGQGHPEIR